MSSGRPPPYPSLRSYEGHGERGGGDCTPLPGLLRNCDVGEKHPAELFSFPLLSLARFWLHFAFKLRASVAKMARGRGGATGWIEIRINCVRQGNGLLHNENLFLNCFWGGGIFKCVCVVVIRFLYLCYNEYNDTTVRIDGYKGYIFMCKCSGSLKMVYLYSKTFSYFSCNFYVKTLVL